MSTQIDNRIVSMEFKDNGFTSGASSAMTTLSKLAGQIPAQGISTNIENALSSINYSGLEKDISTIGNRFTWLGDLGFQAMQRINKAVIDLGSKFTSTFITGPIKQGFDEYETKMKAITTITTNTAKEGITNSQIKDALAELNEYADKTIYNFAEMTRNIGTFTAAGVKFNDAVPAIKGIANWAATAGSSSAQAANAMYQLSQSLSTGSLKLQDWNSVVNAGMGGQNMQEMLMYVAKHKANAIMKELKAKGLWNPEEDIDSYNAFNVLQTLKSIESGASSFRDELKNGLISSDALIESLNILAGTYSKADLISMGYTKKKAKEFIEMQKRAEDAATKVRTFTQLMDTVGESIGSVWASVWEAIVGDYDQATETFTKISKAVDKFNSAWGDGLVGVLKQWNELGGRAHMLSAIETILKGIGGVIGPVVKGFASLIPKNLGAGLAWIAEMFDKLVKAIQLPAFVKNGWNWFWDFGGHIEAFKGFIGQVDRFLGVSSKFEIVAGIVGKAKTGFDNLLNIGKNFIDEKVVTNVNNFANSVKNMIANLEIPAKVKTAWDALWAFGGNAKENVATIIKNVDNFTGATKKFDAAKKYVNSFYKEFKNLVASPVIDKARKAIDNFKKTTDGFGDKLKKEYIPKGLLGIQKAAGLMTPVIEGAFGFLKDQAFPAMVDKIGNTIDLFKQKFEDFKNFFSELSLSPIGAAIKQILDDLQKAFDDGASVIDPSKFVADFAAIGENIANIPKSVYDGVKKLRDTVNEYVDIIMTFPGVADTVSGVTKIMMGAFGFIGSELETLGIWGATKLIGAASGIGIAIYIAKNIGDLIDSFAKLNKSKAATNYTAALKNVAVAVATLVGALIVIMNIKDMETAELAAGTLTAMVMGMVVALGIITKLEVPEEAQLSKKLGIMMGVALSVMVLSSSLKKLAGEDTTGVSYATGAILTLVLGLAAVVWAVGSVPHAEGAAGKILSMVAVAIGIRLLVKPIKELGALGTSDVTSLKLGMTCVLLLGGMMAAYASFAKSGISNAIGMVVVAAAIRSLSKTAMSLKDVKFNHLIKGFGSVLVLMTALTYFASQLKGKEAAVASLSGAMVAMGISINLFAHAMDSLKSVNSDVIFGTVVSVGSALVALVVATKELQGQSLDTAVIAGSFIGLAAGLVVLGEAMKIIDGVDPTAIGSALGTFIIAIVAFVAAANLLNGVIPGVIAASGGMLIFSAALVVFASGVKALQEVSFMDVIKAIGEFAVAIVALGALAVLVSNFTVSMVLGAAGIAAFGASLGVVGIGLSLLTRGLSDFGAFMSNLINGILDELEGLINKIKELVGLPVDVASSGESTVHEYGDGIHGGSSYALDAAEEVKTGVEEKLELDPEKGKSNSEEYLQMMMEGFDQGKQGLGEIGGGIGDIVRESIFGEGAGLDANAMMEDASGAMNGLTQGITDGSVNVNEAVGNVSDQIYSAFDTSNLMSEDTGDQVMSMLALGLQNSGSKPVEEVTKTVKNMNDKVQASKTEAKNAGRDWGTNGLGVGLQNSKPAIEKNTTTLINSMFTKIKNSRGEAKNAGKGLANAAAEGIGGNTGFTVAGANAAKGFANGIENNAHLAAAAGRTLGQRALTAMERKLDEHSPSKETFKIGKFFVDGFVNGVERLGYKAANSAAEIGTKAMNTLTNSFQSAKMDLDDVKITTNDLLDYDPNPVITPVVDTANLSALDNLTATVNGAAINDLAGFVDSVKPRQDAAPINNTTTNNNYNFTQTNNSPKALSRFDIYKQTQMQFATAVGAV